MANIQELVKDVCRLADAVVKNPSTSLSTTAANIGVCGAVAGFAKTGVIVCTPPTPTIPLLGVVIWIAEKLLNNKEKERQEKERMLRDLIRKQQAVINKLNEELARSRQQNAQNRQEIENLKEMLRMLEEIIESLKDDIYGKV